MRPGTSLPPSPKPASSALGDRSHRWTLTPWTCSGHALFCLPKPWAKVPHGGHGRSLKFPLSIWPFLSHSECPQCGREALSGQQDHAITAGQQDPLTGCPLSIRDRSEAISRTESQFCSLGTRGSGPEGLESHSPPQEKLGPDSSLGSVLINHSCCLGTLEAHTEEAVHRRVPPPRHSAIRGPRGQRGLTGAFRL